ncbi:MAG TPA: M48 family metallopeptidase [Myxococcales bacterium]|nr:M48 family metallopeptidase [Myxococcales bacterium]
MTSLLAAAMLAAAPAHLVPAAPPPAAASGASGSIDPEAATRAYLDQLPADQRARSDAYFEGGYWLSLWSFLWGAGVFVLLLHTGLSARMRDFVERVTRVRALQTAIYWTSFAVALEVLSFPLFVYRDYLREHSYGLSNLSFGGWLGEELKGLAIVVVLGSLGMIALYAVVRRLPRTWWMWAAGVSIAFLAFGAVITPVLIVPIFNHPTRLQDPRVVAPILSLARANGIATGEVWEIDASKQTKRVSANVSGLFGTERITLNDNLLNRSSLPEIEAVMGHEMGHYVLNHVYKGLMEFGIVFVAGFAVIAWLFERLRLRNQARWRVRDVGDLAGLPLAALLFSAYLFVLTPALNSIIRVQEYEADIFGLNAAQQPDGFAQSALKLAEYRKLEPGPLEEVIFFDHPSGRTRIFSAMRWKAEHPASWAAARSASAPPSADGR